MLSLRSRGRNQNVGLENKRFIQRVSFNTQQASQRHVPSPPVSLERMQMEFYICRCISYLLCQYEVILLSRNYSVLQSSKIKK